MQSQAMDIFHEHKYAKRRQHDGADKHGQVISYVAFQFGVCRSVLNLRSEDALIATAVYLEVFYQARYADFALWLLRLERPNFHLSA